MRLTDDRSWGVVLIGLGVVSVTLQPFDKFSAYLGSKSENVLTSILLVVAVILICIAMMGSQKAKLWAAIWTLTP